MDFPLWIDLGLFRVHPHFALELLAYAVGFQCYRHLRKRHGDTVSDSTRWSVFAAAVVGAALGSKLLALFNDPFRSWAHRTDPAYLWGAVSYTHLTLPTIYSV